MPAGDLTARIRALYEETSVPVREIAAIAGVSERTLYKYVVKHGWKKRYAVMPRGLAAAAANRGRRWAHRQGLAPAKGAGGRFIRRADIGKPFAAGLKALDAEGRAQALARCDEAEPAARAAQAAAELRRLQDRAHRALDHVNRALSKLIAFRQERQRLRAAAAKQRAAFPRGDARARAAQAFTPADQDMIEQGYLVSVQMARAALAAAQKERDDFHATLPASAAD